MSISNTKNMDMKFLRIFLIIHAAIRTILDSRSWIFSEGFPSYSLMSLDFKDFSKSCIAVCLHLDTCVKFEAHFKLHFTLFSVRNNCQLSRSENDSV